MEKRHLKVTSSALENAKGERSDNMYSCEVDDNKFKTKERHAFKQILKGKCPKCGENFTFTNSNIIEFNTDIRHERATEYQEKTVGIIECKNQNCRYSVGLVENGLLEY